MRELLLFDAPAALGRIRQAENDNNDKDGLIVD